MPIKVYKPTTAGRRKMSVVDYSRVSRRGEAPQSLFVSKSKSGGRNNHGKITVRHIGGGARKMVRVVDNKREKFDMPARIAAIDYDPGHSAFLALVVYRDGDKRYILAPHGVTVGDTVITSDKNVDVKPGNRTHLANIPAGTLVHDIELSHRAGGRLARGAGSYATIMSTEGRYAILKLPSGEMRRFSSDLMATIGQVSNMDHFNERIGKAGRSRHMGIRPTVRGKVMNPVDHPHGGGEGRNPIGLKYPKTPWGKHALGVKTRQKNKASNKFIIKRRK